MVEILPKRITHVGIPPLKIQGIKTKLVPFIAAHIHWDGNGTWYEPFMGSGVVGFNIEPDKAVFSDSNPHIINLYKDIQNKVITPNKLREFLEEEGYKLSKTPSGKDSYYYKVRDRFNSKPNSYDFLFLQRSNFNGMVRFGPNGYNVPFGRKPERFRPALITKIVNQVKWISDILERRNWRFIHCSWKELCRMPAKNDIIYLDPPYIGRNSDYYNKWVDDDAIELAAVIQKLPCIYVLSMWYKNKYRKNSYISLWDGEIVTNDHFYFIGGKEENRNHIIEALVIKKGYLVRNKISCKRSHIQESLLR